MQERVFVFIFNSIASRSILDMCILFCCVFGWCYVALGYEDDFNNSLCISSGMGFHPRSKVLYAR